MSPVSYATTDASTQDGQPVELYKVVVERQNGTVDPVTIVDVGDTTVTGALVTGLTDPEGDYRDFATWTETADDCCGGGGPCLGTSFALDVVTWSDFRVPDFFTSNCVGLGAAHGFHLITRTISGLVPGRVYRLRIIAALAEAPGGVDRVGVSVNGVLQTDNLGWAAAFDSVAPNGPNTKFRWAFDATANGSGQITVVCGTLNFEFTSGCQYFLNSYATVELFDATLPDDGSASDGSNRVTYHYTSADVPVSFAGEEYLPAIFTRSEIQSGGRETGDGDVDLTLPRDHAIARHFHYGTPQLPVALTLYALHRDNLTADGDGTYTVTDETEVRTLLDGAMGTRPRFRGNDCTLAFAPAETLVDRTVPRYTCSRSCPWLLYDTHTCKASKATFALTGVAVGAVSGRVVTVPGLAAWAGSDAFKAKHGVLIPPTGAQETITDVDVAAETVTLLNIIPGLAPGDVVDILAGCDQTVDTCRTRFDNVVNFGGWDDMPVRSPWTGGGLS
jgi:hypothetical protein